eukprot:CAMPEP_0197241214 /NCGR_PEP_ID=MMETSP1429-20130617/7308_1 /TAXON_ID=49237 /ORGANISM="Chaetoceros  sp., Strain UNC1202" /LENGTH=361 /DNA_ID=CAMNT_0042701015 /DNA_START=104 /DNA_END=1189 /DNA_ORIENTATION=-
MDPTTNILKRSRQDAFDSDTAPAPKPEESAVKLESNTDNTTAAPESPPPVKTPSKTKPKATPKSKSSNKGRHGDPRMHRAVAARLMNPELSLLEALIEGGFKFPEGTEGTGKSDRNILDADGVLLCQRKNQLSRRLRLAKKRQLVTRGDGPNIPPAANVTPQDGDSRTLQNMLLNGQVPIAGSEMPAFASRQLAPSMYAQQPNVLDNVAHSANDPHPKRQFTESNLDQYLQMTVRSMGLRPEQFQQFNNFPNNAMMAGFVGNTNPFQNYASLAAQQQQPNLPPNILAAMEQQQQLGNGVMDNTAGTAMNMNMNMQNNPMAAMMNMQQHPQQQLNASDLSRMLLNRSILMNNMDPQVQSEKV